MGDATEAKEKMGKRGGRGVWQMMEGMHGRRFTAQLRESDKARS